MQKITKTVTILRENVHCVSKISAEKARKLPTLRHFQRECEGSYQTKFHLKTSTEVRRYWLATQSWGEGFYLWVNCDKPKGVELDIFC